MGAADSVKGLSHYTRSVDDLYTLKIRWLVFSGCVGRCRIYSNYCEVKTRRTIAGRRLRC